MPARSCRPEPDGVHPAIVFVHGGGFILRGLGSHDEMCRRLAAGTGSVVIAVDCRAAPEHPYPAVDDACTAVLHIAGNAGALGLDPARTAVAGIRTYHVPRGVQLRSHSDTSRPRYARKLHGPAGPRARPWPQTAEEKATKCPAAGLTSARLQAIMARLPITTAKTGWPCGRGRG